MRVQQGVTERTESWKARPYGREGSGRLDRQRSELNKCGVLVSSFVDFTIDELHVVRGSSISAVITLSKKNVQVHRSSC